MWWNVNIFKNYFAIKSTFYILTKGFLFGSKPVFIRFETRFLFGSKPVVIRFQSDYVLRLCITKSDLYEYSVSSRFLFDFTELKKKNNLFPDRAPVLLLYFQTNKRLSCICGISLCGALSNWHIYMTSAVIMHHVKS